MTGHYVRVQEAAALLGVSPATIRWYSLQEWLPTYRVGRGQIGHRRFRYPDLQRVAARTGRFLPDEAAWDQTVPISVEMAAQYLGLSARYLIETHTLAPGQVMEWESLMRLERDLYPEPAAAGHQTDFTKEEYPVMPERMMMRGGCRCGSGPRGKSHGRERAAAPDGWPVSELPGDDASLMTLRRLHRHLAVQKADLEDQLAELDKRIQEHPDRQD